MTLGLFIHTLKTPFEREREIKKKKRAG